MTDNQKITVEYLFAGEVIGDWDLPVSDLSAKTKERLFSGKAVPLHAVQGGPDDWDGEDKAAVRLPSASRLEDEKPWYLMGE